MPAYASPTAEGAPTKALVTGGAGFIGSTLARALLAEGWDVRILDSLLTSDQVQVPPEAEFLRGDIRSPDDVAAAMAGVDTVFHQAAIRSVAWSVDDPMLTLTSNVQGTLQVLLGAREAGVRRVVNASTCAVYGDSPGAAREDQHLEPLSPYAASKIAAEGYARLFSREYGLEVITLRYFNVFGPGQHPESGYSAVFPAFVAALSEGRAPELHWDGEQTRDFVAVSDVVRANLTAAGAPAHLAGEVFNVASGTPRSVNEILRVVADATGTWIEPTKHPQRPGDVRHASADTTKARTVLGFEAQADFAEVVGETVRWFAGLTR